jgi:hypothetical protein
LSVVGCGKFVEIEIFNDGGKEKIGPKFKFDTKSQIVKE